MVELVELKLIRKIYSDKSAKGELYYNNIFECYTLEDKVRAASEKKIAGQTAIAAGRYKIIIDKSQRFGRLMPHLLDVPDFEGVRIHSGNTDKDTEGCILVGMDLREDIPDYIGRSTLAFDVFFKKLQRDFDEKKDIWIDIVGSVFVIES